MGWFQRASFQRGVQRRYSVKKHCLCLASLACPFPCVLCDFLPLTSVQLAPEVFV